MCEAWRRDFARFLADMGPRPSVLHSIDRIDNDGPYAPGNCRWTTDDEQGRNKRQGDTTFRRTNRLLEFQGERLPIVVWLKRTGLTRSCLFNRMRRGWSVERALTTPA